MGGDGTSPEKTADPIGRLSQIGSRTNQMSIEALLRALPRSSEAGSLPKGWADAAREAAVIARRMLRATDDFRATMPAADHPRG
ncbi:MAG: hypothetical protein RLY86_473 [Pseudomonadota bacterium]